MAKFEDLIFKSHPLSKGWAGFYEFKNGYRISVTAGESMYCIPKLSLKNPSDYESFEVAILDSKGEWATQEIIEGADHEVIGWIKPNIITEIMQVIETTKKD